MKDPDLARLGFCPRCDDFTGMCAAGRKIVNPDPMTMTTWHTPCIALGSRPWQISHDGGTFLARLCSSPDAEVRAGNRPTPGPAAWLDVAAP